MNRLITPRRRRLGWLSFLLFCYFSFWIGSASTAGAATIGLSPVSSAIGPAEVVTLDLSIDGLDPGVSLGAFDLRIAYDPSILSFEGAVFGGELSPMPWTSVTSASASGGVLSLFEVSLAPGADLEASQSDSFLLAQLQFISGADEGISDLTIEMDALLSDLSATSISIDGFENAAVAVVPEPSAALLFGVGIVVAAQRLVPKRTS